VSCVFLLMHKLCSSRRQSSLCQMAYGQCFARTFFVFSMILFLLNVQELLKSLVHINKSHSDNGLFVCLYLFHTVVKGLFFLFWVEHYIVHRLLLHFAWVVDDAKCIVVMRVCVCVCVSVCLSAAVRPHYCTDPDVTWGRGRGCPLVVHYWADL